MYTTEIGSLFSVNFSWDHPVKLNEKIEKVVEDSSGDVHAYLNGTKYTIAYKNTKIHWKHPLHGSQESNLNELVIKSAQRQNIALEKK